MGYSRVLGEHFYSVRKVLGGHCQAEVFVSPGLISVAAPTLSSALLPKHACALRAVTRSGCPAASRRSSHPSLV